MEVAAAVVGKEYAPKRDGLGVGTTSAPRRPLRRLSASDVHSRSEAGTKRRRITCVSDVPPPFSRDRGGRLPWDTRCRSGAGASRRRTRRRVNRIVSKRNDEWEMIRFRRRRHREGRDAGFGDAAFTHRAKREQSGDESPTRRDCRFVPSRCRGWETSRLEIRAAGGATVPRGRPSRSPSRAAMGRSVAARRRSQRPVAVLSAPMAAI